MARRWPISSPRSNAAWRWSTARWRGWAAALMPPARRATSRARTWSTCSTGSASRRASISGGLRRPAGSSAWRWGVSPLPNAPRRWPPGRRDDTQFDQDGGRGVRHGRAQEIAEATAQGARPRLFLYPQHAEARRGAARWRLDLLGDPAPSDGAPAP